MNIVRYIRRVTLAMLFVATAAFAEEPIKVVYHFSEGLDQAARGMRNISNHLASDPKAKIVVVGHGLGVDFLLKGAKDKNGNAFENAISSNLVLAGVEFRVCNNTLTVRNIDPAQVIGDAKIVPSGVAEVARLQAREGFVYLKP